MVSFHSNRTGTKMRTEGAGEMHIELPTGTGNVQTRGFLLLLVRLPVGL